MRRWKHTHGRQAVSPVIATILMVAVTVVISGVLLVLVLGMMDTEGVSPTGVLDVKKISEEDIFEVSVKAMTFSISADEAYLAVNGQKSLRTLDSYPANKPYSGNGFTYNTGPTSLSQVGTGTKVYLDISESLRGSVITVQLMRQNGAVMGSISFFDSSQTQAGEETIDMSDATWKNDDPASFPLEFSSADKQHVSIPQGDIEPPTRYFNVTCEVELNLPPSEQQNWATIININGDRGYRLQLSGTSNDNQWFEFGAGSGNWIRSDGTGGGTATEIKEGVRYQVWGVMDFELKKVSIWVNATDDKDTMVLNGMKNYGDDDLPERGSANWHIGSTSTDGRHFDGVVHWLNVETQ